MDPLAQPRSMEDVNSKKGGKLTNKTKDDTQNNKQDTVMSSSTSIEQLNNEGINDMSTQHQVNSGTESATTQVTPGITTHVTEQGYVVLRVSKQVTEVVDEGEKGSMVDDDMSMTAEERDETAEEDFQVISRNRDRYNRVLVDFDKLDGADTTGKRRYLIEILRAAKVNTIGSPRVKTIDGEKKYSVAVENEEEVKRLLGAEFQAEDSSISQLFTRENGEWRQQMIKRSVEVYGLPPRTPETVVRLALQRFGAIESVKRQACSRGIKVTFTVSFEHEASVDEIKKMELTAIYVGNEHARLGRLGEQRLVWNTDHVKKLARLPTKTTPLDLSELLTFGATFIDVPKTYTNQGVFYRREAFIYFRNEHEMENATRKTIKIGVDSLEWCDISAKVCYACGSSKHIKRQCELAKANQERIARMEATRLYSSGQPLKVSPIKTYANIVKKTSPHPAQRTGPTSSKQPPAHTHGPAQPQEVAALIEEMRQEREEMRNQFRAILNSVADLLEGITVGEKSHSHTKSANDTTSSPTSAVKLTATAKDQGNNNAKATTTQSGTSTISPSVNQKSSEWPTPQTPFNAIASAIRLIASNYGRKHHILPPTPTNKMQPSDYSDYNV